jgi:hypothetical protein
VPVDPGDHLGQVGGGELPFERGSGGVVAVLEGQQPFLDLGKAGEVVGGQDLALHDGEEAFGLVQP